MALCNRIGKEGLQSIFPWIRYNDGKSIRCKLIRIYVFLDWQKDSLLIYCYTIKFEFGSNNH